VKLEGKVAAITGGTAGIGRAIAEAYLAEGARVVVNGRNADRGKQVAAELGDPDRVPYCEGDATTKEGVEGTVEAAVDNFGRIDIMINTFEQMVDLFAQESAIKRPNTLDEVAAVAVLLASDVAAGITGSIYSVDGGTAAY
jgi:NAD(P)-dependent dehydrogenase (short-subunit alcohol dehydrogenase family)